MSEVGPPPPGVARVRNPVAQERARVGGMQTGAMRSLWLFILVALCAGLGVLSFYMAAVARHPITSPHVIAPAVGAVWFGIRAMLRAMPKV